MIRSWASLAVFVVAGAVSVPSAVRAEIRTHTVKQSIDTLHVSMQPGRQLVLSFKAHIISVDLKERGPIDVDVRRQLNTVTLFAAKKTPLERMSARIPIATGRYTLFIEVTPAVGADVDDAVEIGDAGLVELCKARDDSELADEVGRVVAERDARHRDEIAAMEAAIAAKEAEHERELVERDIKHGKIWDRRLLGQVSARLIERPLQSIPCERQGQGLMMCAVRLMLMGQSGLLRLTINNRSAYDAPVGRAQVYSGSTGDDLATSTHIAVASQGSAATDPEQGVIGVIPRGGSAILSIKLRDPDRLGPSFKIVLNGNTSVFPAMQPVHLMDRVQLEAEERERQRQRDREAKRVQVHVTGSYGALFVSGAGADGSEVTEATGLMGLGARVIIGVSPGLAFEAEIAGGSGGETSAQESAQLGRVILGGRIRRGESTVWHARMGFGFQALRTATAAGTETEGSGVVALGVGLDWRLGDQFTAGVSAGGSLRGFEQIQTIEAGLHLGLVLAP